MIYFNLFFSGNYNRNYILFQCQSLDNNLVLTTVYFPSEITRTLINISEFGGARFCQIFDLAHRVVVWPNVKHVLSGHF